MTDLLLALLLLVGGLTLAVGLLADRLYDRTDERDELRAALDTADADMDDLAARYLRTGRELAAVREHLAASEAAYLRVQDDLRLARWQHEHEGMEPLPRRHGQTPWAALDGAAPVALTAEEIATIRDLELRLLNSDPMEPPC